MGNNIVGFNINSDHMIYVEMNEAELSHLRLYSEHDDKLSRQELLSRKNGTISDMALFMLVNEIVKDDKRKENLLYIFDKIGDRGSIDWLIKRFASPLSASN